MSPLNPSPKSPPSAPAAPENRRWKVLIVDDDRAVVQAVHRALAEQGYDFFEAGDGGAALTAIREHRPDVAIMDVEMPGLGGVEVCRIVKANQRETGFGFIPVILMTARQAVGKIEGLELGADDFLIKPFDAAELSARVKSMLRLKSLQDTLVQKNRELQEKQQELLALSRTDALTGLFNRRFFEERLALEFARADRYHTPLSCLMLDIDHFKDINDSYGHAFGDRVLREIAKRANQMLRDVDLLARYGGEELVALLPETGPRQAFRVGERIRQFISEVRFEHRSALGDVETVGCTVSIGIASYPVPSIESHEGLLRAADTSLYAAKWAGKNSVRQFEG
jgi:diguanylate cyclase (GGDEF)-like protein